MTLKTKVLLTLILVLMAFCLAGCPPSQPDPADPDEIDTVGNFPEGQDFQDWLDSGGLEDLLGNAEESE